MCMLILVCVKKCANIYVIWYQLYNFLLGGREADIKLQKGMGCFV